MPDRTRFDEAVFRVTAHGREAILPAGQDRPVHYQTLRRVGIGCITSRRTKPPTFFEQLAWELAGAGDPSKAIVPGCTPAQAEKLHRENRIK